MEPSISFITLGVADLERSVAFYRDGLGLSTQGIIGTEFENGAVAFFTLRGGLRLALWPRRSIAADTGPAARGGSPAAFDGRCNRADGVTPPSNTPGILSRRAWPARRLTRLGATRDFYHGLLAEQAPAPTSFALAHNTETAAEVDHVIAQAAAAGGVIVKPAQKTFYGGYAGYFQDPDGHLLGGCL